METIFIFFQNHIYAEYAFRIFLSLIFGSLLGFERKLKKQIAGIRTLVMISVSSTLLSILSIEMSQNFLASGDPTRIAAGVITGIGFVGGGAIMKQGLNIKGLTTASIIFATAGMGLSLGAGLYIPCCIAFCVIILSLFLMEKFEHKAFPIEKNKFLILIFSEPTVDKTKIESILKNYKFYISDLNVEYDAQKKQIKLTYLVRIPDNSDSIEMANDFANLKNLINFTLSD